jgi:hypothetical protein
MQSPSAQWKVPAARLLQIQFPALALGSPQMVLWWQELLALLLLQQCREVCQA